MQNKDKFKTAREAWDAYKEFCKSDCQHCPMVGNGRISCIVTWLYAEAEADPTPQWKDNLTNKFTRKD